MEVACPDCRALEPLSAAGAVGAAEYASAPNDATERRPSPATGQRISAPQERSRWASSLGVGRLASRREPAYKATPALVRVLVSA